MELIRLAHCVYHCKHYVVLVTKYRREIFEEGVFAYMKDRMAEVTEYYPQIKQKFPFVKKAYWGKDSVWSEGYLVTTVGANEKQIRKYIEEQGKKDLGQTLFVTD